MISQAASSRYDTPFDYFEKNDVFDAQSAYDRFKMAFLLATHLTYEEKVDVIKRVINRLGESLPETSKKIVKYALKCGVTLDPLHSEDVIRMHLDKIVEGIEKAPFPPEENALRKECVKKLVPFVYELIWQGKIYPVLNEIVRAFSKCSIEVRLEELTSRSEENDLKFIVEFSIQLCLNVKFLEDNPYEALKYCIPHQKNNIHPVFICIYRFNQYVCSYKETQLLLKDLFQIHYKELCPLADRDYFSLQMRAVLAEAVYQVDHVFLAEYFLYLFSETEIFEDPQFSHVLKALLNNLFVVMNERYDLTDHYFLLLHSYLQRWQTNAWLRTSGSERIKQMLEEKMAGEPFSLDPDFPKDTHIWREIGSRSEQGETFHYFKLDWDFDYRDKRSNYAVEHIQKLKDDGMCTDSANLLFPALVGIYFIKAIESEWAKILGYKILNTRSGFFLVLPDPSTILKRWKQVLQTPQGRRVHKNLSIAETDGSATVDQYIKLFMKHDVVCSMTSEFIHDQQYHLLPTLNVMMTSSAEAYHNSIHCARESVKGALKSIRKAEKNEEFASDPKMLNILKITTGIFVDVFSIRNTWDERHQMYIDFFVNKSVLYVWRGIRWRNVFKEFDIDPYFYPAIRIQEYWDRIVKGRDELTYDSTPLIRA